MPTLPDIVKLIDESCRSTRQIAERARTLRNYLCPVEEKEVDNKLNEKARPSGLLPATIDMLNDQALTLAYLHGILTELEEMIQPDSTPKHRIPDDRIPAHGPYR